ncbi:MAG: ABC transporter substrate-binding protein [Firmicutes bacterium]|nr:ABC transporter substrate-binding protein [Bacillota bacterium]
MLKKKLLLVLLVVLCLITGIIGIKKLLIPGKETLKVTLGQQEKSLAMTPHLLAMEKKFFQEFWAKAEAKTYSGDVTPQEALARGEVDIVIMSLADFLYYRLGNADLIAFAAATTGEPSFIMAQEKMPDFSWHDMNDKSVIGALPESTAGILLEAVLRENDLAPYRSVNVIYNVPTDLKVGAFKAGSSTYLQTCEPMVSRLETDGTAAVVGSLAHKNLPALVYVTNRQNIIQHPEKIQRFTNGIYKAFLWMKFHPEKIVGSLKQDFKDFEQDILPTAVNRYLNYKIWPETPQISEEAVAEFQNMMLTAGELPQSLDCAEAIEQKFVKTALEKVEYIPPEQQKKGLKKLWPF